MRLFNLIKSVLLSNIKDLDFPYKITFAITYHCNARCKMCNIWKKKSVNELTTDELQTFFKKNNTPWVNITGGEPFIRPDLVEIVKSMKSVYLLNTTTNGILTEKIVRDSIRISRLVPRFIITVSIDGPKELHNYLRGVDAWDKAVNTFRKLREMGIESYIGYTINPYNVGKIKETYIALKKIIPWIRYRDFHVNFYHESDVYYGNVGNMSLEGYESQLIEDIEFIRKGKIGIGPVFILERKYLKLVKKYLSTGKSPLPCKALSSSCFIDPHGNVYPCTIFGIKLGNIRNANYDLSKIFRSKKARKIREMIKEGKCPGCWTPCEAYQTILGNISRLL